LTRFNEKCLSFLRLDEKSGTNELNMAIQRVKLSVLSLLKSVGESEYGVEVICLNFDMRG